MVVLMAAENFWTETYKEKGLYPEMKSNLIRSMKSDIVVIEASFFFWYNFLEFAVHAVKKGELDEDDINAFGAASALMCHIIEAKTTSSTILPKFKSRWSEYRDRDPHENPVEAFVRVLLRSINKRSIDDPDRRLDFFSGDLIRDNEVLLSTTIHVTAMLPAFFGIYKDAVANFRLD